MGIGICLPNIIVHIINLCKGGDFKTLNIFYGIFDLFFWVGLSNILGLYIYIGGDFGYYTGIVLLVLYFSLSIFFYAHQMKKDNTDNLSGWVFILRKKNKLPLVEEAISENTILQPLIKVKARAFHQESREVCKRYKIVDVYGNPKYGYEEREGGKIVVLPTFEKVDNDEVFDKEFNSDWARVDQGGGKFKEKFISDSKYIYGNVEELKH